MPEFRLRKTMLFSETIHHENGPPPAQPRRRAAMFALCRAYGGPEVIDAARESLRPLKIDASLDHLDAVVEALDAYDPEVRSRLTIDIGEARGFDYYTGVRLRAWAPGSSEPIIRGGRYDDMVARYGADLPAVGFAVDLDALERAQEHGGRRRKGRRPRGCLVALKDPSNAARRARAVSFARDARGRGTPAWVCSRPLDLVDAKTLAYEHGARELVHVGARTTAWRLEKDVWQRQDNLGKQRKK